MLMIAALAALALTQEPPRSTPQDPPPVALEDVVVEARRLEALTREFVDEVSAPARRRDLARWRSGLCIGVSGIRQDIAQSLADHVSRVALDLGLRPGDPGCTANVQIVFAGNGQALA